VDAVHLGGERSLKVGVAPSYSEVVSLAISSSDNKLPVANGNLGQRVDFSLPMRGPASVLMEVRSAVNCYDLEKQTLDQLDKYHQVAKGDKTKDFVGNLLGKAPSNAQ